VSGPSLACHADAPEGRGCLPAPFSSPVVETFRLNCRCHETAITSYDRCSFAGFHSCCQAVDGNTADSGRIRRPDN